MAHKWTRAAVLMKERDAMLRKMAQIDRWIDILVLRKNGATLEEIGLAEDVSRERISQLERQAIRVATHRIFKEVPEEARFYGL